MFRARIIRLETLHAASCPHPIPRDSTPQAVDRSSKRVRDNSLSRRKVVGGALDLCRSRNPRVRANQLVPELTRSADIKLNERLSLRRRKDEISLIPDPPSQKAIRRTFVGGGLV